MLQAHYCWIFIGYLLLWLFWCEHIYWLLLQSCLLYYLSAACIRMSCCTLLDSCTIYLLIIPAHNRMSSLIISALVLLVRSPLSDSHTRIFVVFFLGPHTHLYTSVCLVPSSIILVQFCTIYLLL